MKRLFKFAPVELLNFFAFVFFIATVGWVSWYYLDITLDKVSALVTAATGGLIGTAYGFLPERTKTAITARIRPLITSETVFFSLVGLIISPLLLGLVCTKTVLGWKGELPAGSLTVDGEPIEIEREDRTYKIWSLPFAERLVSVQDLSRKVTTFPYLRNRINLTDEELYATTPVYRQVTDLLQLSLYQYVENRYLAQAQSYFLNDPRAKKFVSLNLVYDLLRRCLLEDDIARVGDLSIERF